MKARGFIALTTSILIFSCTSSLEPSEITPGVQPPTSKPVATKEDSSTPIPVSTLNALNKVRWNIYSPDPQHLWNRIFRQLYRRTTKDGQEYGWDSLDPLLLPETTYLLEGTSYQQTISVLDEFLSTRGEDLITDPLMRAIFQRDMWAVFDWLTTHYDGYSTQRQELQWRLAQVIQRVALTDEEILSLQNNYEAAVKSKTFPTNYQGDKPDIGFLPLDLFKSNGEWVCVGREGGPIAITHTEEFPFFGRSAFLVFIRVPGGREATLRFLRELNSEHSPSLLPYGSEVALVRRAMVINEQGNVTPSPIVESVQIRHFNSDIAQSFYEFKLNRGFLLAGISGGLQPVVKETPLFHSDGNVFQAGGRIEGGAPPNGCFPCHGSGGFTANILSYSRRDFPLPEGSEFLSKEQRPILVETTPELEAQAVINWKQKHQTWQALETLWHQGTP